MQSSHFCMKEKGYNMGKLKKIDAQTNVLTWFEIPVADLKRAMKFYETILDLELEERNDGTDAAVFFPSDPDIVQATSGRVTGVLSQSARNKPSAYGTMVYINASPRLRVVLDKVVPAGGKVLSSPVKIPPGYIAVILDSEGNRVGLHAEEL